MFLFHTSNLPHHGLERVFQLAKEAGFDGIEVEINQNVDTHNPAYLKELEARYKLPIRAFSLDVKRDEKLVKVYQDTVREFEGCILNLHPPGAFDFKYQRWLKEIAPLLAKKYRHNLYYRNLPPEAIAGFIPKRTSNNLDALKSQGGVCLDLTACALNNMDILLAVSILKGRLQHVYLSNVYRRVPYSLPDRGVLPLESFLTKLAKVDFNRDFTLRVTHKSLQEGNEEVTLKKMKESVEFFRQYFQADADNIPEL